MAQFSMEIMRVTGSVLRGNQQASVLVQAAEAYAAITIALREAKSSS